MDVVVKLDVDQGIRLSQGVAKDCFYIREMNFLTVLGAWHLLHYLYVMIETSHCVQACFGAFPQSVVTVKCFGAFFSEIWRLSLGDCHLRV